jgi:predicted nucleic acid-binding protein
VGSLGLPPSGSVYLDANCVIYAVEKIPPYDRLLEPLWRRVAAGELVATCSELVVCETLVKPIREGHHELASWFRRFLVDSQEFRLEPISLAILERAARIRAETGLRTPDAIHAATALEADVSGFFTNDPSFRRMHELKVILLSDSIGEDR